MNPFLAQYSPPWRVALRKVIRSGAFPGILGMPGKWVARHIGWPLYGGVRLFIQDPTEAMQSLALSHGAYEPNIAYIIAACSKPGCVFVDVGANIGSHSLIAAKAGATVFSFEPLPRLAAAIERSARLNGLRDNITVFQFALGESNTSATLFVADRADDGSHSLIPGVDATSVEPVDVRVVTLDWAMAQHPEPDLIKVDVEGYEARVLDGATELLDKGLRPIWIVETADRLADQIGESASSVLSRLEMRGYEIWRVPDVGPSEKVSGNVSGALSNYCAVHSLSTLRQRALDALRLLMEP